MLPDRFEWLALGVAGGALVVGVVGFWLVIGLSVGAAVGSYAWRVYLAPFLEQRRAP